MEGCTPLNRKVLPPLTPIKEIGRLTKSFSAIRTWAIISNLLTSIFIILLLAAPCRGAEELRRVAILPFQVNSKANADRLQKEFYEAIADQLKTVKSVQLIERDRLAVLVEGRSGGEALAQAIGRETGAAFVITGTLTEFGDVISADVRILDVKKGLFLPPISAQGKGLESIGRIAAQLAVDIRIRMGAEERIARIEFRGNRRIEGSAINQVLKSATGNVFSEANLAQDIRAIYRMGYFSDVAAEVREVPEGKVIAFTVQERGIVTTIDINGSKAVSKEDIEAVLGTKVKQIINPEKIKADVEKIKDLYDSKGYYNAEVKEIIEKAGEKDARVIFSIVENERLYIIGITFAGNEAFTAKELAKVMKITEKGLFSFITDSGILKKEQLRQDVEKINAFYLNNGFIYAQVGEPEITHDRKGIYIKIPVTEGKQFQVGKVEITGDEIKVPRSELLEALQVNKKRYYDREAVMKDIDYIQQACSDEGFAYAEVVPRTIPHEQEQMVDVNYQINKGKQVYFNRINISGNTKTRDKVLRRLLTVVEGNLYNKTKLKQSYMALNRLRYFEEVDFQTAKGLDDTLTDVNIRVKEKPTGMFSIGAGYSALDNAILTAQVSQQNLFGRGQSLSLKANISGRATNYELSFIDPWLLDMPLWTKVDLWQTDRTFDTYDLSSQGGGLTLGYPLWEYVTGYAGYKVSQDKVNTVSDLASTYIKRQEGEAVTSALTLTLTRDTTDDNMFPTRGSKNSLATEIAGGALQGDASFNKFDLLSSWFYPLPLDLVFGVRGKAGVLLEREGKAAPVFERYYLGGINSLRGLRNIGPVDPLTGDVIGGLTMLNFNAELVFPLIKDAGMRGVVFYDTGNSWQSGYDLKDMRKTAGLGVRWYSPIGPLRLEWGYVLDSRKDEAVSRWEFTIGMVM